MGVDNQIEKHLVQTVKIRAQPDLFVSEAALNLHRRGLTTNLRHGDRVVQQLTQRTGV